MQNRGLVVAASVIGLLIFVVAPIVTGFVIERTFPTWIEAADESSPDVEIESALVRGAFISTAETTLRFGGEDDQDLLVVRHEVVHGPIPVGELWRGRSPLALVVAVVDTRYDVDPEALPNIAAALAGRPLIRLIAWLGLDRSVRLELTSPAIELPEARYRGEGFRGEAVFTPDSGAAEGHLWIGAASLGEASGGALELAPSELSFRVEAGEGARPAEGSLDLGAIALDGPDARIRIAPSRATFAGHLDEAGFETGRFDLTIGDIVSEPTAASAADSARLIGLRIQEESEIDADRGLRSLITTVGFDQLSRGADVYGPGQLVLAVRNIDVAAAREFRAALSAVDAGASSTADEDPLAARLAVVEQYMPRLLGASPEIVIERFTVGSPHGELTGGGRIAIDGRDPALVGSVLTALMQTRALIEFAIPAPIMRSLVESYVLGSARDEMPEVSEDELRQMASFMGETVLEQLVARGVLVQDGAVYRLDARYEDGMPSLNGQPIDPMSLPGFGTGP